MRKVRWILFVHIFIYPIILSLLGLVAVGADKFAVPIMIALYSVGGLFFGIRYGKGEGGQTFRMRYLPVYLPLFITTMTAAVLMVISEGFFGHQVWAVFVFMLFPFLPYSFLSAMMGQFLMIFVAPFLYYLFFLIGFSISERRTANKEGLSKLGLILGSAAILLFLAVSGSVLSERSKHVLPSYGFEYGNGYSSVDLEPYYVTNPNNILPTLDEPVSFTIDERNQMPVLDGAEAAYPVYSAFANATYKDIRNQNTLHNGMEIVSFTNTIYAFEQLVSGNVDIFFGAHPSPAQQSLAESNGKELVLTPIGKEAFVFFVNEKNPVDSLSSEEIKDIYSGKVTNWEELGGKEGKIVAFQRPADSGSQTIMEKFMGDTPLIEPLKEEIAGMGDVMEEVANYRNYKTSIGYSFRFFSTGMNPNENIKLISLNGIEPSAENISDGSYPYVVNLYAITVKDNQKKTIKPMLDWMQGVQGQRLVEDVGYIPMTGNR